MASAHDANSGPETAPFIPALLVVDMQEDFCPPVSQKANTHNLSDVNRMEPLQFKKAA
jgi:hypothetical protein